MYRPLALCLVFLSPLAVRANGGEPHDHPSREDLLGPSTWTTGTPSPAPEVRGRLEVKEVAEDKDAPTDRLGASRRLDREQTWARDAGLGLGHLAIPERLVGVRLDPRTEHFVFAVEGRLDDATDSGLSHLGVTALGRQTRRFEWGLGQVVFNDNTLSRTRSFGLNIGFVRYRDDFRLGSMLLEVDAHLTANLFQQTESDSPLLRGLRDGIRPCATQSEIGLRLKLHITNEIAMTAFAIDQDDPFHFVSGNECFGDGAVWMQSSKAGFALDARLGRGFVLSAGLTWATAAVGYDLEAHRHGVALSGAYRNTNVEAGLSLVFSR